MALHFVLGPAGAGKTHFCIHRLAAEIEREPLGPPLLFLLPEQATFIHERLLAQACPGGGFCRAEVTSFSRLVYRAYQRAGVQPLAPLSEGGKLMLGAAVTADCRDRLQVLAAAAGKRGFANQVMGAAEELFAYDVDPDRLDQALEALEERTPGAHTGRKLREIALLYRAYRRDYDGAYGSYGENMAFLAQAIREGFLGNAQVYIDGYAQFTPSERQVVAALFAHCPEVWISLPLDAAAESTAVHPDSPFYPAWSEYAALVELAEKQGASIAPPTILSGEPGRFSGKPDLAAAHRWLLGEEEPRPERPRGLRLVAAEDRRAELNWIAREILRLCREEGLRFREIGLFARDVEPYQDLLPAVFDEMELPYFLDAKKSLLYHPLVELVRSVLEVWTYRAERRRLLRFLKNALHPLYGPESDLLENYILRHGLRFWHWQDPARPLPPPEEDEGLDPAQVEDLRQRGVEPLLRLCRDLGEAASAPAFNARLTRLLAELEAPRRLEEWTQQALERGDGEAAEWHRQATDRLQALLAEAEQLLGGREYPARELMDLYEEAFSGLTISTIPPGVDQVMVGSLERSRHPELRAAFVLSLNEGVLPRKVNEAGLFSDADRRALAGVHIQLAPDSAERQCGENFLLYQALTRSGQRLYLTYLLNDDEGGPLAPSPAVRSLQRVFPALPVESSQIDSPDLLAGGSADLALCSARLSRDPQDPLWQTVYRHFRQGEAQDPLVDRVAAGLAYGPRTRPLSRESLRRWYGGRLYGSVTRLEKYRRCPFAYFAEYGLRVRPRREYQLSPMDRGTLYHEALAEIGRRVTDWTTLDRETAKALVDEVLAERLPAFLTGIMDSSPRYRYLRTRLSRTLVNACLLLARQVRGSGFLPVGFELPFGSGGTEGLPAFVVPVDPGRTLALSGQIDRVDLARSGDRVWLRVVDYKTGKPSFDPQEVAAGLQVQLLLYLQVVMANAGALAPGTQALPAGAYYAYVRDDVRSADPGEQDTPDLRLAGMTLADPEGVALADRDLAPAGKTVSSALIPVSLDKEGQVKPSAACLPQAEAARLTRALEETLRETARAMLDGEIPVSPLLDGKHDSCAYCQQRAVCGFDRTLGKRRTIEDLLGREERP